MMRQEIEPVQEPDADKPSLRHCERTPDGPAVAKRVVATGENSVVSLPAMPWSENEEI